MEDHTTTCRTYITYYTTIKVLSETIETEFNFEETSEETVLGLLNKLKNKNTKGHDQISNKLLKCVKNEIAKPLTFIINPNIKNRLLS